MILKQTKPWFVILNFLFKKLAFSHNTRTRTKLLPITHDGFVKGSGGDNVGCEPGEAGERGLEHGSIHTQGAQYKPRETQGDTWR